MQHSARKPSFGGYLFNSRFISFFHLQIISIFCPNISISWNKVLHILTNRRRLRWILEGKKWKASSLIESWLNCYYFRNIAAHHYKMVNKIVFQFISPLTANTTFGFLRFLWQKFIASQQIIGTLFSSLERPDGITFIEN